MLPDIDNHIKYMKLALDLAAKAKGFTAPNPMAGCVIVQNDRVIGSGFHKKAGENHAEVNALLDAKKKHNIHNFSKTTAYVTLEPCCHYGKTGPCTLELIKHNVGKVIVAMLDPNTLVAGKGIEELKRAGIEVILLEGYNQDLDQKIYNLNRGFIYRMTKNRPFIRSKIAASLDGRVALHNGESKWITNDSARQDVHKYRAYSDAIVTTANTVMIDNPSLNCRLTLEQLNLVDNNYSYIKQPTRVILDKDLITSLDSKVYVLDNNCIIITSLDNQNKNHKVNQFNQLGIKLYYLPLLNNYFDMNKVWELLAELGYNDVMIEAGGRFNGHLLTTKNLVDEWVIYQSGLIMGPGAMEMFNLASSNESKGYNDSMDALFKLKCKQIEQLGDNWRLIMSSFEK